MFSTNKYTVWYYSLVHKVVGERRVRTRPWQYQEHHIIPGCLGGGDEKDNLVLLTPREHYLCHLLLTRMTSGRDKSKMVFAFFRFRPKGTEVNSSKSYDRHLAFLAGSLAGAHGDPLKNERTLSINDKLKLGRGVVEGNTRLWPRSSVSVPVSRNTARGPLTSPCLGHTSPGLWKKHRPTATLSAVRSRIGQEFGLQCFEISAMFDPLDHFDRKP